MVKMLEDDQENGPKARVLSKSELRKLAQEDLNETTKTRRKALEDLREWIDQQDADKYACLLNATDEFLLRFLRMQKTDVQKAAKVLDNYLGFRTNNPEWFNLDVKDETLNELMTSGYILVLPGRDANGRRVVFSRAAYADSTRYTSADIMRAHLVTYEALLMDEENQINGITYLFDEEGITFSNVAMWTPSDVTAAFKGAEKAVPIRHSEINIVGMPWIMTLIFQFAKSLLSYKLRSRLHTQASFEKVREFFPAESLPEEYGGKIPLQEMVESWKAELEQRREKILSLSSMKYFSKSDDDESHRKVPSIKNTAKNNSKSEANNKSTQQIYEE